MIYTKPVYEPETLRWHTAGAWRYALGDFGCISGFGGLSPWAMRIRGRSAGLYRTLDAARRALERAALDEGFLIDD